jgi:hypothetical protein
VREVWAGVLLLMDWMKSDRADPHAGHVGLTGERMKHHCPMCGEQWNEDQCESCGWREGKPVRYTGGDQPVNAKTADRMRWTLDNIYTSARRELRKGDPRGMWGHVIRLCEKVGCQSRGVLRDNGGSVGEPGAADAVDPHADSTGKPTTRV